MNRLFVTVLVVVALAVGAVPLWGGVQARGEWNEMMRGLSGEVPGWQVRTEDYSQGWLRSKAKTRLWPDGINPESGFVLDHTIVHGPLPLGLLFEGETPDRPALAVVDTDFTPDLSSWPAVEQALGDRPFARLRVYVNPDRSGVITLHSPELHSVDPPFSWQGAQGRMEFSSEANGASKGTIYVPAFAARIEKKWVKMAALRGEFSGALMAGGLPLIDGSLGLASLEVREVGSHGARFAARKLSFEQKTDESADGKLVSFQAGMKLESVESEGEPYGPFEVDFRFYNLDIKAIQMMRERQRQLSEASSTPEEKAEAPLKALMEVLPRLLAASPGMELKRLSVGTSEGDVDARAKIWLDPSAAQLPPPLAIMAVRGEVDLELPHSAVHALVDGYLRKTMGVAALGASISKADQTRLQVEVVSARTQLVQTLVEQGWLNKGEKTYATRLFYDGTAFTVNGRPLDPMALAAMSALGASSLSP